jgi:hypothetical protein
MQPAAPCLPVADVPNGVTSMRGGAVHVDSP